MRIQKEIINADGRYQAQLSVLALSAAEEELFEQFGEPSISLGGTFTDTVSRPGQTTTTITITGGGGSGAAATTLIDAYGVVTGFTITAPGTGYTSVPTVTVVGDGTGATGTAVLTSTALTSITLTAGGRGYHVTPVTVDFILADKSRNLPSEFPVKQVFDLQDYTDADIRAKVWLDAIEARISAIKADYISRSSPLESFTVTTL